MRIATTRPGPVEGVFVRESLLQEETDGKVRCNVCERRCTLRPGGFGWCRTRQNRAGKLVTLIYGSVSSLAANPIEKKPFYHFYPGTRTLTAGSWSCNFACPWCQNWRISKVPPPAASDYVSPERFVEWRKKWIARERLSRSMSRCSRWNRRSRSSAWPGSAASTIPT